MWLLQWQILGFLRKNLRNGSSTLVSPVTGFEINEVLFLLKFSRIWRSFNYLIFITLTKFWFYFHFYRKSRQEIHAIFFFSNGKFSNRSNATFQNTVSPCTIAVIGLISELIQEFSRFWKHKIVIIKRTIIKVLLI